MVILVDGNNMAHRARHAYNLSYRGADVSVMYGVVRMLQTLVSKHRPDACVVCWDGGTPAFRKRLVPSYKAHRHKAEDPSYPDFIRQLDDLREILPFFGVLSVWRRGIEADDLLYQASRLIWGHSLIVTSDQDLLQAVTKTVSVLVPSKNLVLELDEMDVPPDLFVEWKTWQGDSSDGVPGVVGIGPKTATKIVFDEPISDRLQARADAFFQSGRYNEAYDCMDLSQDRSGARYVLLNTPYIKYHNGRCMRWALKYGFMSLVETRPLGASFGRLQAPEFDAEGLAVPRVWDYARYPVDVR